MWCMLLSEHGSARRPRRVKRSLNLASGRSVAAAAAAAATLGPPGEGGQQQQAQEGAGMGAAPAPGGVRKRSELFSPPVARKFSRSMEDIVAADLVAKLQLGAAAAAAAGWDSSAPAALLQQRGAATVLAKQAVADGAVGMQL